MGKIFVKANISLGLSCQNKTILKCVSNLKIDN
jgi:hypothetical protein